VPNIEVSKELSKEENDKQNKRKTNDPDKKMYHWHEITETIPTGYYQTPLIGKQWQIAWSLTKSKTLTSVCRKKEKAGNMLNIFTNQPSKMVGQTSIKIRNC
jgi:hypothetical protein